MTVGGKGIYYLGGLTERFETIAAMCLFSNVFRNFPGCSPQPSR